jgi:UDP-glucuronate 4-epimerase
MINSKEKILITGCAGFIGMHLCESLLRNGNTVIGIDNINDYYDRDLKLSRLKRLKQFDEFYFKKLDISNYSSLKKVFDKESPEKVVNLAAQAGVRYSLENPHAYIQANIVGFMNILECSRFSSSVNGLIYASSSSVYGGNKKYPFSIKDNVDRPISIYAATKKSNELMAHTYSHLYNLNTTGLRFFTVYGPWGRPDMAMYIFTKKIIKGEYIPVFNHGKMRRDFTYVKDIISGINSAIEKNYKCEVFNLGNSICEKLSDVILLLEDSLSKKAKIEYLDMQPGDVEKTFADVEYSKEKLNYNPSIKVKQGIPLFIKWFKAYNKVT